MKKSVSFAKKFVTMPRVGMLVAATVIALLAVGGNQVRTHKPVASKTTPQTNVKNDPKPQQNSPATTVEAPAPKPETNPPAAAPATSGTRQPEAAPKASAPQTSSPATIVVIPQIMASALTVESDPVCTLSYTFDLNYAKFAYVPAGVTQDPKNITASLTATYGPSYELAPASVSSSFTMAPGSLSKTMQININKTSGNGGTYVEFPVTLHLVISSSSPNVSFGTGSTFAKDIPAQCH